MTPQQFKEWSKMTTEQQTELFKNSRKELKLNQAELGEKLSLYGYSGGRSTVQKWEQGLIKIPPLVYDLIVCGFADRKDS